MKVPAAGHLLQPLYVQSHVNAMPGCTVKKRVEASGAEEKHVDSAVSDGVGALALFILC